MRIEGVNISTALNRQLQVMGNSADAVKVTLRRLARGSKEGARKIPGGEAGLVCKRAGMKPLQHVMAAPYGDDGFMVFFYRTGSASFSDAWLAGHAGRFKGREEDPHVWAFLLGKFDGDTLVEPVHDNTPEDVETEAEEVG